MRSIRLRKILRDLVCERSRTLLVVLSMAVGIFALSLTLRTQAMLSANMLTAYAATNPSDATLTVSPFGERLVAALRRMPELRAVEGQSSLSVRVKLGDQWQEMVLLASPDFSTMPVSRLTSEAGAWPPPDHTMLLERSYTAMSGVVPGDTVLIETPKGRQVQVPVSGLAHDLNVVSGRLGSQTIFGYISLPTARWLGLTDTFNTLQIIVADDHPDTAQVQAILEHVRTQMGRGERPVIGPVGVSALAGHVCVIAPSVRLWG